MIDIILSRHGMIRMAQRSINISVIDFLISYGEVRRCRDHAESFYFSKRSLRDILDDHGLSAFKACEKMRNAYIVIQDGVLITVARSHRRTIH